MAAKRLSSDNIDNDIDHRKDKRMRAKPSFASVIGEVMMARSAQCVINSIEPLLRRVVNEEVERGIQRNMRTMTKSPSLRIQAPEPAYLKLVFLNKTLPSTIFTCNKILDINGESLKLVLVEKIGDRITPEILRQPLKVEIVVINGDFPSPDCNTWTVHEFSKNITKERSGRRPLITKDVNFTIRGESCVTLGEIEFTDNSSWIRSRKFKLGARVISETPNGVRILEALTEAFVVKDQRGELYKKHYPPALEDEVWRLEKIGKDGKFHKRLDQAGIKTVQDLLKQSVVDPNKLKKILVGGKAGMSDRMWETVLKHAKTCNIGNKLYIYHESNYEYTIMLDATCNIVSITNFDGQIYSPAHFTTDRVKQNETMEELVKNAYENWNSLEVVEGQGNESLQQFQGKYNVAELNNLQQNITAYDQTVVGGLGQVDGGDSMINNNNIHLAYGIWDASPQLLL
ncbi:Protein SAR DEFICIENT 1 [Bienertia sinuspersici]